MVGVQGVATVHVFGVTSLEGFRYSSIAVVDEIGFSRRVMGDFFESLGGERVSVAVMETVFADVGVGVALIVQRTVAAEFDVFLKLSSGFDLSGVGVGFSRGMDIIVGVRFIRGAVEAAVEEFSGGGKAVAGFEVGEFALHHGDEEANGGTALVGFFAHDLGEFAADEVVRGGGFGRGGAIDGVSTGGRVGAVVRQAHQGRGGLGRLEAEFDEEPGGVEAVAGLEVRELAVHGGGQEADDEATVLGFLGDDVG